MALLQDKILITTGSASGIGLSAATLSLDAGAKVFGVDISPAPPPLSSHLSFSFLQINLADTVISHCIEAFGPRIDGLMNVAGVMDLNASVDTVTDEIWEHCLSVNLTAPTKRMQAVIPYMRQQKAGSIVRVASKAGVSGAVAGVAYTTSKHGLIGATENIAFRFKDENIRCNTICPGGVATGITGSVDMRKFAFEAMAVMKPVHEAHNKTMDIKTAIQPDEVAQFLLFLVSDSSSRISGAVIPIDTAWSVI